MNYLILGATNHWYPFTVNLCPMICFSTLYTLIEMNILIYYQKTFTIELTLNQPVNCKISTRNEHLNLLVRIKSLN